MKKKVLIFALILSALLCVFAISVFAGDIITVDNIKYEITSSSTVNFNANDPTDDTALGTLKIPETITYNGTTYTVAGVTRGRQWVTLKNGFELLDTPGTLWPNLEDQSVASNLALIGSIRNEVVDVNELCIVLIDFLTILEV